MSPRNMRQRECVISNEAPLILNAARRIQEMKKCLFMKMSMSITYLGRVLSLSMTLDCLYLLSARLLVLLGAWSALDCLYLLSTQPAPASVRTTRRLVSSGLSVSTQRAAAVHTIQRVAKRHLLLLIPLAVALKLQQLANKLAATTTAALILMTHLNFRINSRHLNLLLHVRDTQICIRTDKSKFFNRVTIFPIFLSDSTEFF